MAEAGYDPSAMLDVMKILKKASGDRTSARNPGDPSAPGNPARGDPGRAEGGVSRRDSLQSDQGPTLATGYGIKPRGLQPGDNDRPRMPYFR